MISSGERGSTTTLTFGLLFSLGRTFQRSSHVATIHWRWMNQILACVPDRWCAEFFGGVDEVFALGLARISSRREAVVEEGESFFFSSDVGRVVLQLGSL